MNRYARDFIIRTWLTACMVAGVVLMSVAPATAQSAPAPLSLRPIRSRRSSSFCRIRKPSALKAWAEAIAARCGRKKAKVALARRLAVLLHRLWRDRVTFVQTVAA
jgi:hypothetical protein